jgi:hypothetical protein
MNEFLAQLYNTSENIGASSSNDVEKLAQATVVDQLIKSEGLSIDDVSAETILKIAEDLFGPNNQIQKTAEEAAEHEKAETAAKEKKEEAKEETAEEKMAQADFLGRQMAHAYVNELATIEKDAGGKADAYKLMKNLTGSSTQAAKHVGGQTAKEVGEGVSKFLKGPSESVKGAVKGRVEGYKSVPSNIRTAISGTTSHGVSGMRGEALKNIAKKVGPEAAAAAAGGGGVAAYHALKKKESSAIDMLAEKRAYEILAENGITEQGPSEEEVKLANAVEEKAWELLAANGYVRQE